MFIIIVIIVIIVVIIIIMIMIIMNIIIIIIIIIIFFFPKMWPLLHFVDFKYRSKMHKIWWDNVQYHLGLLYTYT